MHGRVSLDFDFWEGLGRFRIGVNVVILANHVVHRESVHSIVLALFSWRERPSDVEPRVGLFAPARAQIDHGLAVATAEED